MCVRNKKYCILNREYSKEEYGELREQIVKDMEIPYIDSQKRVWKYGEFLPYDISPFAYNETSAMEYYPLTKEQILGRGWRWSEPSVSEYAITKKAENLPDSIADVSEEITKEIIECLECKKAFRVIPVEFNFLKRYNFPLPRKCPNCRHKERFARINPPQLWIRKCAKCGQGMKTSYAPERPEIVYCEQCYNAEIV